MDYSQVFETIEVTKAFKKKLVNIRLDKNNYTKIKNLIICDISDAIDLAPLYMYKDFENTTTVDNINSGLSRLVYDNHPLYYVIGTNYIVYNPKNNVCISSSDPDPTEIVQEFTKIKKSKSIKSKNSIDNINDQLFIEAISEVLSEYDPYNMKEATCTICNFLEAYGRPISHCEFDPRN